MSEKAKNREVELVKSLRKGDLDAFEQLYNLYNKKLFYFAKGYLKTTEDAEELVQEVFIKIWENRSKLKEYLSFNAFLYTITYNSILKFFRKRGRERRHIEEAALHMNSMSNETVTEVEYNSLIELMDKKVESMPEKRRNIFKLSRQEGLSNQEIATKLHISKKTVENQIYQSLKFLRKEMVDESILTILFIALFIS